MKSKNLARSCRFCSRRCSWLLHVGFAVCFTLLNVNHINGSIIEKNVENQHEYDPSIQHKPIDQDLRRKADSPPVDCRVRNPIAGNVEFDLSPLWRGYVYNCDVHYLTKYYWCWPCSFYVITFSH